MEDILELIVAGLELAEDIYNTHQLSKYRRLNQIDNKKRYYKRLQTTSKISNLNCDSKNNVNPNHKKVLESLNGERETYDNEDKLANFPNLNDINY